MIKYALGCEKDHEFEGWFSSSDEFDRLVKAGHVDCPQCGSTKISKLLMAPSVKTSRGKDIVPMGRPSPVPVPSPQGGHVAMGAPAMPPLPDVPAEVREQVVEHLREIKKHVMANAENVGDRFADEARKIHYGESKQRGIYGSATPEDAAELVEEGVEIMPLPLLPEDRN